jgi:hypothetical protein
MRLEFLSPTPLVTLALVTYNSENFIEKAVDSVFTQDYPKLEIILSDDCSEDSTFQRMESAVSTYTGDHDITLFRNDVNIGLASHVNQIFRRARGSVIVFAAGDDISLPSRVTNSISLLQANPRAVTISFSDVIIDKNGAVLKAENRNLLDTTIDFLGLINRTCPHPSGASRAYRREVFDLFGPLAEECPTEDTTLMLRSLILGEIIVAGKPGIMYRRHSESLTGGSRQQGISVDQIHDQYRRDLAKSKQTGLLADEESSALEEWIETSYRRNSLLKALRLGHPPSPRALSELVFSRTFSNREKASALNSLIRSVLKRIARRPIDSERARKFLRCSP